MRMLLTASHKKMANPIPPPPLKPLHLGVTPPMALHLHRHQSNIMEPPLRRNAPVHQIPASHLAFPLVRLPRPCIVFHPCIVEKSLRRNVFVFQHPASLSAPNNDSVARFCILEFPSTSWDFLFRLHLRHHLHLSLRFRLRLRFSSSSLSSVRCPTAVCAVPDRHLCGAPPSSLRCQVAVCAVPCRHLTVPGRRLFTPPPTR